MHPHEVQEFCVSTSRVGQAVPSERDFPSGPAVARVHRGIEKVLTGILVHFVPEIVVAENHMPVCEILEIAPQSRSYFLKMISTTACERGYVNVVVQLLLYQCVLLNRSTIII